MTGPPSQGHRPSSQCLARRREASPWPLSCPTCQILGTGLDPRPAPHLLSLALLSRQLVQEAGLHHLRTAQAWESRVLPIPEARPPLCQGRRWASRGSGWQTPFGWGGGSVPQSWPGGRQACRGLGHDSDTLAQVSVRPAQEVRGAGPALHALRLRGPQAALAERLLIRAGNPLPPHPTRRLGSEPPSSGGRDQNLRRHVLGPTLPRPRSPHTCSRPPCPGATGQVCPRLSGGASEVRCPPRAATATSPHTCSGHQHLRSSQALPGAPEALPGRDPPRFRCGG